MKYVVANGRFKTKPFVVFTVNSDGDKEVIGHYAKKAQAQAVVRQMVVKDQLGE